MARGKRRLAEALGERLVRECKRELRAIVPHILHRTIVSSSVESMPKNSWWQPRLLRIVITFEVSSASDYKTIESMMVACVRDYLKFHSPLLGKVKFLPRREKEIPR